MFGGAPRARPVSLFGPRSPMNPADLTSPMPDDPLVRLTRYGFHLPAPDLHLDARHAPGTVFVSHAHSDHCSSAARILCTPETAALHEARRPARPWRAPAPASGHPREAVTLGWGESLRVAGGGATVTLTPAGHALGSAMIVAESAR